MNTLPTAISGYYYRPANNDDGEAVRNIIFNSLTSYGLEVDLDNTDKDLFGIESYYPDSSFWVIVDENNTILGSFALYPLTSKKIELRKMYFSPAIRGLGLGKWVMQFVEQESLKRGYHVLSLETASVLVEAIQLYKKNGFVDVEGPKHSCRCDTIMEKVLQDVHHIG